MGLFNLFKKKKVEEKIVEEEPVSEGKVRICQSCQMSIHPTQKYTKQMGLYFHRRCWNKERASSPI